MVITKIDKIVIHNYRGIHDTHFSLKNYSLLVGPNNAGKSTVINAIRAFYEKDGFKFKRDSDIPFIKSNDKESWIEITYQLSKEEHDSLAKEYQLPARQLIVKKFLETEKKTAEGKSATNLIFGKKTNSSFSDEPFYGAKNVQNGKFGEIIYIPAVSKVDEHTKLTGPSALRDLLQSLLSENLGESDTYQTFNNAVSCFSDGICKEKTKEGYSISGFENDLNDFLKSWSVKFSFKLNTPSTNEIVKSMLDYDFQDLTHKKFQDIENFGSRFSTSFYLFTY